MKSKILLKEKAFHGTALVPVAIHHLSYTAGVDNYFYLHWHDEFEFIAVLEGGIVYTVEDRDYSMKAGEGLFVRSNLLHAARSLGGGPCEACVVLFHPRLFGGSKQGTAYTRFVYPILKGERTFDPIFRSGTDWQKTVLELLREMDDLKYGSLAENELLLKSKIFEIWHMCYRNSSELSPGGSKKSYKLERMQPVLDYIHANYREEISLSELARLLPMSEGHFCHAFKEVMNIPPIAYVIRYRILQSCSLLAETDAKIADVARSVGFNNISYFNREFIKAVGCSPGRYRREG